jgi:hypothetical protein
LLCGLADLPAPRAICLAPFEDLGQGATTAQALIVIIQAALATAGRLDRFYAGRIGAL